MKNRIFYYIQSSNRCDGNDVSWLGKEGSVHDLRLATVYSRSEMESKLVDNPDYKAHAVHKVNKLISWRVPVTKIVSKRGSRIKPVPGEKCFVVCTRDTVGTNAAFWRWNHNGYTTDVRAAQIVEFDPNVKFTDRKIDVLVPTRCVEKFLAYRVDIQDLNDTEDRDMPWVLQEPFFY